MHETGRYSSEEMQQWRAATGGSGAMQLDFSPEEEIPFPKAPIIDLAQRRQERERQSKLVQLPVQKVESDVFAYGYSGGAASERQIEPREEIRPVLLAERGEKILQFDSPLEDYIAHFDKNWLREGLPQDWYRLQTLGGREAGFSMKLQMQLLTDTQPASVAAWADQTETDLRGFCLEYLSGGVVYPYKYEKQDGYALMDMKYQKDILAVTSEKERDGIPKRKLSEAKDFLWNAPDTSVVVIPSPSGPSGLFTDEGKAIVYPDSYFFVLRKIGDTVEGGTFKTDFSRQEISRVIYETTGQYIPPSAPLGAFCEAVAFLTPGRSKLQSLGDFSHLLRGVRSSNKERKGYIFENKTFDEVDKDVANIDTLYHFGEDTDFIIAAWKEYVMSGEHSQEEYEKSLAATMYRLSKLFLFDAKQAAGKGKEQNNDAIVLYGAVLEEMASIAGCQGGGRMYVDSLGGVRTALIVGRDERGSLAFSCPFCGYTNLREEGGLIRFCQNKKCGRDVSC
jgi:hypothetical protein